MALRVVTHSKGLQTQRALEKQIHLAYSTTLAALICHGAEAAAKPRQSIACCRCNSTLMGLNAVSNTITLGDFEEELASIHTEVRGGDTTHTKSSPLHQVSTFKALARNTRLRNAKSLEI